MVEYQQGLGTFLSFAAKSVKPEILEKLLVGRKENVDFLEHCVFEIANEGQNHHKIVIGQRGMGKTHIIRVLFERSNILRKENKIVIAYFTEEEYGIAGYLDFLIRVLNAFVRWNDADKKYLLAKIDILRETHNSRQIDVAETIILEYIGSKPMLILAENFDNILESLGKDGQSRLRAFLYRHNKTSIIATAQALSPDLEREDRPFYGFFTNIYLKKLTYESSLELLRNLATIEKQQKVIDHLDDKGIAQVRAIHDLVKGNHRLLVTFYEFLKADTLATLSTIFIKTLNDLKPYYETFIRYLPAQQQKILHYLALSKKAQNGTEIQKNCFIDQKTLSKQLSELQRRNLIDAIPDPTDRRNKLYDIAEPLLRISIEIGEHKEGISALFIDFLALYYSFDELFTQRSKFENLFIDETDPSKKQILLNEVKAREDAIAIKTELEKDKNCSEEYKALVKAYTIKEYIKVINLAIEVTEEERDVNFYSKLGFSYGILNDHQNTLIAYKKCTEMQPDISDHWYNLGYAYYNLEEKLKAIDNFKKAVDINPDFHQAWYNLGNVYKDLKSFTRSISSYQKSLNIAPNKWEAWVNLGNSFYIGLNDLENAIEAYVKAIETGYNFIKTKTWESKEFVLSVVSNNIIFILKKDKNLRISRIQHLENLIEKEYEMPEELKTVYSYLQIYRRFVFEKEEKAIYDLPKEQREFFMREILGKK